MSLNLPVVNAPYLSVSNLELSVLGDETLSMAAGRARDSSNQADIILSAAVTVSNIVSGLNGLDTGTVGNSKVYAVYVVGDSSLNNPEGGLLSLDQDEPLLPAGYDMYRLIGYAMTDGTADFLAGYWYGSANERQWNYDAPLATAVTAGAATSYTAVSLLASAPSKENVPVMLNLAFTPAAASRTLKLTPGNGTGDAVTVTGQVASVIMSLNVEVMAKVTSAVPEVDYKVSNADSPVAVNVAGFRVSL